MEHTKTKTSETELRKEIKEILLRKYDEDAWYNKIEYHKVTSIVDREIDCIISRISK